MDYTNQQPPKTFSLMRMRKPVASLIDAHFVDCQLKFVPQAFKKAYWELYKCSPHFMHGYLVPDTRCVRPLVTANDINSAGIRNTAAWSTCARGFIYCSYNRDYNKIK